ncbi:MAG: hypothetical protein K9N49_07555 [Candidatus Marinimicrobia bacterium]|nr:hypothetical protein [Candidatus Neomarinimicrobiota bacterium]
MSKARFITGIYNYCDYWCERCAFTQRCRNYSSGRAERRQARPAAADALPDTDATNAAFWESLAEQLVEVSMVSNSEPEAFDVGIEDLEAADEPDDAWLARDERRRQEQARHPLVILSRDYRMQVHAWLKTADGDLKAVARDLLEEAGNRFGTEDVAEQARDIGELIEVVAWYHTLIATKLGQAVHGLLECNDVAGPHASIIAESRRSDANGSGKVALAGIERSIAAWLKLRGILPAQEDLILAMLSLLDRLRRRIYVDLPDSVTFLRPGFDGEDVGLFD